MNTLCKLSLTCLFAIAPLAVIAGEPPKAQRHDEDIDWLIALLGGGDFKERERAQKELVALGSVALAKLESAHNSPDKEVARRAKAASAEIRRRVNQSASGIAAQSSNPPRPPDPKRIEELISNLGSNHFDKRASAQRELVSLGSIALPKLEAELMSTDAEVSRRCKAAIGEIKQLIREATTIVVPVQPDASDLMSDNPYQRMRAAQELAHLRDNAKARLPEILRCLDDWEEEVRSAAISALCTQKADPKTALPKIMAIVRNEKESTTIRGSALVALRAFMPESESAVPELVALLRTKTCRVRPRVAVVLGQIGANQWSTVLPALFDTVNDPDRDTRVGAATGLSIMRKDPQRCVLAIHKLLEGEKQELSTTPKRPPRQPDERNPLIISLIIAIQQFGAEAALAIPTLAGIANDQHFDDEIRISAVWALRFIGSAAIHELEHLAAGNSGSRTVTSAAATALGSVIKGGGTPSKP